ncbi:hypothetical protein LSH36_37g16008 [Paralvinella palmiformis]|uniref:Uncharacterized protein n=1 Tax=Paralvinella palmiformis TaxID=53620 RepID=A0AAD9NFH0_9ANNE|nr:hypothetical protein LSH36_37g16008 [Paralvinella palmiformis]
MANINKSFYRLLATWLTCSSSPGLALFTMSTLLALLRVMLLMTISISLVSSLRVEDSYNDYFSDEMPTIDVEKKSSGMRLATFRCNGYDHLPRCLHGGKGPRKTWTKAGRFCVCLCRGNWVGPECAYSADSLRKRYPWKGKRSEQLYDLTAV